MAEPVKENLKKPYIQKNVIIDKNTVKKYIRPDWHREFREKHISTIKRSILHGEHPSQTFTINELSSQKRLILDGNHRMEAIRQILKEYETFSIEVTLTIYYNLTHEEEIKIYEKINNTKKESGYDKLKAHIVGTEIYKLIEEDFPSRVVYRPASNAERNVISAMSLFTSYAFRNKKIIAPGGSKGIINAIILLGEKDYDRMKSFVKFFKRVCGEPSRNNMYSSHNLFCVLSKIYYTLVGTDITEDEYETRLKRVIAKHTSDLMMFNKGVDKQKMLYEFVLDKIKGRKPLFNVYTEVEQK